MRAVFGLVPSLWGGRDACAWGRPASGVLCGRPGLAVGGKGTVTFRERAVPRDCLVGAGRFGDLIRTEEVGGGNLFSLPVTAAA